MSALRWAGAPASLMSPRRERAGGPPPPRVTARPPKLPLARGTRPGCGSVLRCGGCGASRHGVLAEPVFVSAFCAMATTEGSHGEPVQSRTQADPHLVVTCARCGYWWAEDTLADSDPQAFYAAGGRRG